MSLISKLTVAVNQSLAIAPELIFEDKSEARGARNTSFLPSNETASYPDGTTEIVANNSLGKNGTRHYRFNIKVTEPTGAVVLDASGMKTLANVKNNLITLNIALSFNDKAVRNSPDLQARLQRIVSKDGESAIDVIADNLNSILNGVN